MEENIRLIDLVIELLDARAPLSSRNPDIDKLSQGKARLVLLNKADLADARATAQWETFFSREGIAVVTLDSRKRDEMKKLDAKVAEVCQKKIERDRKRGIKNRPVRAMVVGIPNVGKSTFINSYAKKAVAKTGNKPGVTKGKQWIKLSKTLELLDTPGILWPKFEDPEVGFHLAALGSVNDQVVNTEELWSELLTYLKSSYAPLLKERYDMDATGDNTLLMEAYCQKTGCLKTGGELDYYRASLLFLDDFRSGKIGKITLELPREND